MSKEEMSIESLEGDQVIEMDINRLRDFKNHPFKITADISMVELKESIQKFGILNPLIVRPVMEGYYEIISGHRRRYAARQCLLMQNQVIEQQLMLEEMAPKARYLDQILQSPSLVLTTQIAKDYGMSATRFNRILHDMKIQYKVNDQWILYANYQGKGYVHSRTITIPRNDGTCLVRMQTEWTQEGRRFLYEELKEKRGILPLIEGGGGHAGRS